MIGGSGARIQFPTFKDDALLDQTNPVSGTPYTLLSSTNNVRIIAIMGYVTWTVQPSPLEFHIVIDGVTYGPVSQVNPVSDTNYLVSLDARYHYPQISTTTQDVLRRSFLFEGRNVSITLETTGGTVQKLYGRCKYQQVV